jgi:hypothetical protein
MHPMILDHLVTQHRAQLLSHVAEHRRVSQCRAGARLPADLPTRFRPTRSTAIRSAVRSWRWATSPD